MKPTTKFFSVLVALFILAMVLILATTTTVFQGCGNKDNSSNSSGTDTKKEADKKTDPNTDIQSPDAQNYPWNAGEQVPDNILAELLPMGDIPTNTIGGFGFQYENAEKTTALVFLWDDSLRTVQKTAEGGDVRNVPFTPEVKGSWPTGTGSTWIPKKMESKEINGRKCWLATGIDIKNYNYHQMGLTIFIGYSLQGGPAASPKAGWDKWLFDQRERANLPVIPGTYTNGGGGANCWFRVK